MPLVKDPPVRWPIRAHADCVACGLALVLVYHPQFGDMWVHVKRTGWKAQSLHRAVPPPRVEH